MQNSNLYKLFKVVLIILKFSLVLTGLWLCIELLMSGVMLFDLPMELNSRENWSIYTGVVIMLGQSIIWLSLYYYTHSFISQKLKGTLHNSDWSKKLKTLSIFLICIFLIDTMNLAHETFLWPQKIFHISTSATFEVDNLKPKFEYDKKIEVKRGEHNSPTTETKMLNKDTNENISGSTNFEKWSNYLIPRTKGFTTLLLAVFTLSLSNLLKENQQLKDELETVI